MSQIPLFQRIAECPYRRSTSCGDIDVAVGRIVPMPLAQCDQCWVRGGPKATAWRAQFVALTRSVAKPYPPPPPVKVKWWGLTYRGTPWPKRPWLAGKAAYAAFVRTWKALDRTGCGCIDRVKAVVERRKCGSC